MPIHHNGSIATLNMNSTWYPSVKVPKPSDGNHKIYSYPQIKYPLSNVNWLTIVRKVDWTP